MLKSDEGRTVSYWEATDTLIERDPLAEPLETDVCIIGGGIAGLTSAYLLANAGVQVAVIDDGLINAETIPNASDGCTPKAFLA